MASILKIWQVQRLIERETGPLFTQNKEFTRTVEYVRGKVQRAVSMSAAEKISVPSESKYKFLELGTDRLFETWEHLQVVAIIVKRL